MDLQSLTANKAYQLRIFQYASQHDFGGSSLKMDNDGSTPLPSFEMHKDTFSLYEVLHHASNLKTEQVYIK